MPGLAARVKVVAPGVTIVAGLSALLAVRGATMFGWDPTTTFEVWLWVMAGPFAEPCASMNYSILHMLGWGAGLLAAVGSHPFRPNLGTGCLSALALFLWFLLGCAYTFAGV
jgi:hypothetical protein